MSQHIFYDSAIVKGAANHGRKLRFFAPSSPDLSKESGLPPSTVVVCGIAITTSDMGTDAPSAALCHALRAANIRLCNADGKTVFQSSPEIIGFNGDVSPIEPAMLRGFFVEIEFGEDLKFNDGFIGRIRVHLDCRASGQIAAIEDYAFTGPAPSIRPDIPNDDFMGVLAYAAPFSSKQPFISYTSTDSSDDEIG